MSILLSDKFEDQSAEHSVLKETEDDIIANADELFVLMNCLDEDKRKIYAAWVSEKDSSPDLESDDLHDAYDLYLKNALEGVFKSLQQESKGMRPFLLEACDSGRKLGLKTLEDIVDRFGYDQKWIGILSEHSAALMGEDQCGLYRRFKHNRMSSDRITPPLPSLHGVDRRLQ